jgi:hypothetical protein
VTYINKNGYEENSGSPALWSFIFGAFYFIFKGIWIHAVIYVLLAIATGGIGLILVWVIYPFFANSIVENHYLKNGWIEKSKYQKSNSVNKAKNDDMKITEEDYKNNTYYYTLEPCSSNDFINVKKKLSEQYKKESYTTIKIDSETTFQLRKSDGLSGYIQIEFKNKRIKVEIYNVEETPIIIEEKVEIKVKSNNTEKLIELSKMLEKGLITEDEFKKMKTDIV